MPISLSGSLNLSGSLTTTGTITATTLVVQTITSSISSITGSTNFGSLSSNTHTFTGSLNVTGAFYVATGSVGIGTISPNRLLDVSNTSGDSSIAITSADTTGQSSLFFAKTSDTNIGGVLYTHSDNVMVFRVNDATRMTISGSGNVGIGTTTPKEALEIAGLYGNIRIYGRAGISNNAITSNMYYDGTNWVRDNGSYGAAQMVLNAQLGSIIFGTTGSAVGDATERMRITSTGNVGIGTSTPDFPLVVKTDASANSIKIIGRSGGDGLLSFYGSNGTTAYLDFSAGATYVNYNAVNSQSYNWYCNSSLKMTLTSGGTIQTYDGATLYGEIYKSSTAMVINGYAGQLNLQTSGTNKLIISSAGQIAQTTAIADWSHTMTNSSDTSPNGMTIIYSAANKNNTSNEFLYCTDNSGITLRFKVASNGGIYNFSANNSNLSDERVKKDIVALESYWNKFKNIGIVKFKYKDQTHDDYNIGVIAQQVESIAPEFVNADGFGITPEDGIPLKSIYEADLHHATIKVLQEAMAKIETLEARVQYLENK